MININITNKIEEGLNEMAVAAKKVLDAFKEIRKETDILSADDMIKLKEIEESLTPLLEPIKELENTKIILA